MVGGRPLPNFSAKTVAPSTAPNDQLGSECKYALVAPFPELEFINCVLTNWVNYD